MIDWHFSLLQTATASLFGNAIKVNSSAPSSWGLGFHIWRSTFFLIFRHLPLLSAKFIFCLYTYLEHSFTLPSPFVRTPYLAAPFAVHYGPGLWQYLSYVFVYTVAPACKVSVLSKENWPYKRADLTTRQRFYCVQSWDSWLNWSNYQGQAIPLIDNVFYALKLPWFDWFQWSM